MQNSTKRVVTELGSEYSKATQKVAELTKRYNESAEKTGRTSAQTKELKAALASARAELKETTSALKSANVGMTEFGGSSETASGSLTGAITKANLLTGVISKVSSMALSAAKDFIQTGIQYNAQLESYTTGLTNMLGSAEAAKAAMDAIQEDAARTPFDVASLTQANQLLISAGENAGYSRKVIMALGDAVSATGGGNAELSRMSANLQQIANVGKASAIDIKQFAYAGINVYQVLADYTGKSVQEVQKMTISYDTLSQALIAASEEGGRYYNAMDTQSQTMNGRVSTLKDNASQLAGLMTSNLSEAVGTVISKLNDMTVAAIEAYKQDGWWGMAGAALSVIEPINEVGQALDGVKEKANAALTHITYLINSLTVPNFAYSSEEEYAAALETNERRSEGSRETERKRRLYLHNQRVAQAQAAAAAAASSITGGSGGSSSSGKPGSKSTTETVISSISRTATTTAQNALGTVTTSIQTLSEKVKDSAGSIKDRITETTTETGKEMVNGIETTYKQVETKVNGVVTKTTKTYDDMSKTLAATLTRTTSKVEGGVTTAIQEVTKKYADGSEHIEKTETITEENIVDGVARTTKTINTYIDGVLQNTKVDTEEAEKSIQAALSRTEKYISEIQGQSDKGIFGLVKSLFTDIKNKDGKAIAGDVVKVIFGQVTQEQRNTILKWADDAMTAINEHYAHGGIQEALQSIADLFSNGITPAVDGSTEKVKSFAAVMKSLSGTGGSGGIVNSILKLFGGGSAGSAASGAAGEAASGAIASAAGGAASFFPECLAVLAVIAEGVVGFKMGQNAHAREDSGEERSLGSKLLSGALLAFTGPIGWISYLLGKKFGKKSSSSSAAAESASSGAMSYLDIQDAYWYGNERAFAGYDYRSDPFTYNPNNNSVPKYQAEIQAQLAKLSAVVEQYLPDVANQQIVLDDGTIVGALAPGMNDQLGHIQMLAERGN